MLPKKRQVEILEAVADNVSGLLLEQREKIFESLSKAFQEYDGEGKFRFGLNMKANIVPTGQGWNTPTAVSWAVTQKVTTDKLVGEDDQTDLVDEAKKAAPEKVSNGEKLGDSAGPKLLEGPGPIIEGEVEEKIILGYLDKKSRALFVSDGISQGETWGTYYRKSTGSLKRVISKYLPLRDKREEAQADLKVYAEKKDFTPYLCFPEDLGKEDVS